MSRTGQGGKHSKAESIVRRRRGEKESKARRKAKQGGEQGEEEDKAMKRVERGGAQNEGKSRVGRTAEQGGEQRHKESVERRRDGKEDSGIRR